MATFQDLAVTVSSYHSRPELFQSAAGNATLSLNMSAAQQDVARDEQLLRAEITVQAIIILLAVLGNGLVLLVLLCRKKKLSRMNLLIVHLAAADLFVAFFNVLPQLIWDITFRFQGGNFLCKTVTYFQLVAMYASSYVLVATAVDRYLVICHPLRTHTWSLSSIHLMVCLAWGLSLLLSVPQVFIFSYVETAPGSGVHECWAHFRPEWTLQLYITWITTTIYIIPFIFLSVVYGRICYVVWRSTLARQKTIKEIHFRKSTPFRESSLRREYTRISSKPPPSNGARDSASSSPRVHSHGRTMAKSKVKTFKLTLTVILCYLLCWSPFFISQMWAAWDVHAPFQGDAMVIIMLLASLNSCTNPWIYMAFTDNLCGYLTACCRPRPRPRANQALTLDSDSRTKFSLFTRALDNIYRTDQLNSDSARVVVPLVSLNNRGEPETRIL